MRLHRFSAAALLVLACVVASGVDRRKPMPVFHATTLDGVKYGNDTVKGRVVLLQFWATWCKFCRGDQEAVDSISREFAGKGLLVLAVNAGEPRRKVKEYLAQSPRAAPVVLMENTNLAALFPTESYPLYVAIDADGFVAGQSKGAGGELGLRQLLARSGMR